MRWKVRSSQEDIPFWLWLLCPLWGIPLLMLVGLLLAKERKRVWFGPGTEWSRWFAWHPAQVGFPGEYAWLEFVERRAASTAADIEYQIPGGSRDV